MKEKLTYTEFNSLLNEIKADYKKLYIKHEFQYFKDKKNINEITDPEFFRWRLKYSILFDIIDNNRCIQFPLSEIIKTDLK